MTPPATRSRPTTPSAGTNRPSTSSTARRPPDEHQRAELLAELGTAQRQAGTPRIPRHARSSRRPRRANSTTPTPSSAPRSGFSASGSEAMVGDDDAQARHRRALDPIGAPTHTRARTARRARRSRTTPRSNGGSAATSQLEAVDAARRAGDDTTFVDVIDEHVHSLATPDHRDQTDRRPRTRGRARRPASATPVCAAASGSRLIWARYQQCDVAGATPCFAEMASARRDDRPALPTLAGRACASNGALVARRTRRRRRSRQRTRARARYRGRLRPKRSAAVRRLLYVIRQHQGRLDEIADFFIDVARDNPSIAVLRATVPFMLCELGRIDEAANASPPKPRRGFDFPYDITWLAMLNASRSRRDDPTDAAAHCSVERLAPFRRPSIRARRDRRHRRHRPTARPRRHPARRLRPSRGMVRDRARHPRAAPSARSGLRSANSTTPTSASPAAPTATSNAPATSQPPPQQPRPSTAAPDSPNAPTHSSQASEPEPAAPNARSISLCQPRALFLSSFETNRRRG